MRVEVLLFGPLAERVNRESVTVELSDERANAGSVLVAIAEKEPVLAPMLTACRLAVNHTFARDSTMIMPGDVVAVIGLVSGG